MREIPRLSQIETVYCIAMTSTDALELAQRRVVMHHRLSNCALLLVRGSPERNPTIHQGRLCLSVTPFCNGVVACRDQTPPG